MVPASPRLRRAGSLLFGLAMFSARREQPSDLDARIQISDSDFPMRRLAYNAQSLQPYGKAL